jgi:hypothetical protein
VVRGPAGRARRAVAVGVVAAGALGVVAVAPGRAQPPDEQGYWWRLKPAGAPGSLAPPGVPAGGLDVASDATGEQATSALRARLLTPGTVATTLVLEVAGTTGSGAAITICPTSGWTAPDGAGDWDARPTELQCDRGKAGTATTAGTWEFPLTGLVDGNVLDIVLVPGAGTFQVAFKPPTAASIVTELPPPPTTLPTAEAEPAPVTTEPSATPPFSPPPNVSENLPSAVEDQPSSGLAAPIGGVAADSLSKDVQGFPATIRPVSAPGVPVPAGRRAPLALLAVALVAGTWFFRMRSAVAAAPDHPFAAPVGFADAALSTAGELLTAAGTPEKTR